jgi:Domain of unknown function (DUF6434)/SAP domain-containing new25
MTRPKIIEVKTGTELKKWYWLKAELVGFCKIMKVNYSGSKFEILDRLANTLDNIPEKTNSKLTKKRKQPSENWAKISLTIHTKITENYTNGRNSRTFFKTHCGSKFHFSIPFMAYMQSNIGKTLAYAIDFWQSLQKTKTVKSKIPEGNQYNQYLRDFFEDNPNLSIKEARHFWKLKRNLPLEKHRYEKSDLELRALL